MIVIETCEQTDITAGIAANGSTCAELLKKRVGSFCLKTKLREFDEYRFFTSLGNSHRIYFKSRDRDLILYGVGAAHILTGQPTGELADWQFYGGCLRFDERASVGAEWQAFGQGFFVLPMLQVIKIHGEIYLMMNFCSDGHVPPMVWLDQVLSFLHLYKNKTFFIDENLSNFAEEPEPSKGIYLGIVDRALDEFRQTSTHKKVVIARRDTLSFKTSLDPMYLFARLKKQVNKGFGFFVQAPGSGAFFGISPELLYLRRGASLQTESVAGTRPRARDDEEDRRLKQELLESKKDRYEHRFVSEHVEERLQDFLQGSMSASALSVVSTDFVHHLICRFEGMMKPGISDEEIIRSLHPTPATCGFTKRWALDFIRTHENFDRGFYAGPVGLIGKDSAEFCVAIRSALYHENKLYVYAGSGIVKGSNPLAEWEEINNKQKSIFTIFDG